MFSGKEGLVIKYPENKFQGKSKQTNAAAEKREWLEIMKKKLSMRQDCLLSIMDEMIAEHGRSPWDCNCPTFHFGSVSRQPQQQRKHSRGNSPPGAACPRGSVWGTEGCSKDGHSAPRSRGVRYTYAAR